MGGNSPSNLHHDEGEGGGVTLVEGIRLSDRVIKRMRQKPVNPPSPTPSPPPHADSTGPTSSVEHLLPLLTAPPPAQEGPPAPGHLPGKRGPPPRVTFQPPPPATTPVGPVPAPPAEPPPLPVESILLPPNGTTTLPPPPPAEPAPAPPTPPVESIHLPPTQPTPPPPPQVDQAPEPPESILLPPSESTPPPPPPVESVLVAPVAPPPPPCCPGVNLAAVVPPHEGPSESFPPPPAKEPPPFLEVEKEVQAAPPAGAASLVSLEVLEKEVRRKMKEEMDRGLQKEIERRREELQLQLEAMRAQSHAAAGSRAEAEVAERVKAALEADKAAYEAGLRRAVADERRGTEDERLVMQLYARQLEEKEEASRRRGALYEGRIAKLEAKCTDFYKATAESFQKGKEDAHRRFTRFNIQPVCGDLQSQVLKCYQEQPGKSLCCSGIASAYMRCVQQAKKSRPSTAR